MTEAAITSQQKAVYTSIKYILTQILKVVGHTPEEADENAELMLGKITEMALTSLYILLSEEQQQALNAEIRGKKDVEFVQVVISKFSSQQINDALQMASTTLLQKYFDTIKADMSKEQLDQIHRLMKEME